MSVGDIKKMLELTSLQSQVEKLAGDFVGCASVKRGIQVRRVSSRGTLVTKETTTHSVGQRQ